jgi:hypothetical protein
MTRICYAWRVVRAWLLLAGFDVLNAVSGFQSVTGWLARVPVSTRAASANDEAAVCDAVLLASCLYWKPVLCLQRSICIAALLRRCGLPARLVIGYRPVPFLSHAWVEINGRVVGDSAVYQKRLIQLYVI